MSGSDGEEEARGPPGGEAMDEAEAAPSAKRQRGAASAAQNVQLFAEAGQFNPHAARAERRQRKKGKLMRQAGGEDGGGGGAAADEEYDFEADWQAEAGGGRSNPFAQLGSGSEGEGDE